MMSGTQAGEDGRGHVDVVFLHALHRVDDVVELHGHRVVVGPVKMTPNRKSFQMPVTCRMIATTKIGSDIGSMIWKKMPQKPAPSTRAALNSSSGSDDEIVAEQQRQDRHAEDGVDDDDTPSACRRCRVVA